MAVELNSRERILRTLQHKEPDRIPVDLGSMESTNITATAYNRFKKHLGLEGGRTQIFEALTHVVKVEHEVLEKIGADVVPVAVEAEKWKESFLHDGSLCEVPEKWTTTKEPDGSESAIDPEGTVFARRAGSSYYYDPVNPPLADAGSVKDIEKRLSVFESSDLPFYFDEPFTHVEERAKHLYEETDYALLGNFYAHVFFGGLMLRGYEQFLMDLSLNRELAEAIMSTLVDVYIERFKRLKPAFEYVQVICVNDDLGTQTAPMISPEMYRKVIKPHQKRLYGFIKENSKAYLFLHTDGSVYDFIPDFIEMGIDILNPVQYTARKMDAQLLKKEFGKDLSFWGGGCETQDVLCHGTPQRVKDEVRKQIDILSLNGGFVFCQVHNILPEVPLENIMAMYEAVKELR